MCSAQRFAKLLLPSAFALAACGSPGPLGPEGPQGPAGPNGDPGSTLDPTVVLVVPNELLLDRDVELVLSVEPAFDIAQAGVDLGPGIEILEVDALNTTSLRVVARVAADAPVGSRDVKVRTREKDLVGTKALTLSAPLEVTVVQGHQEQGGLVWLDVKNRDHQVFDPGSFVLRGNGLFGLYPQRVSGTAAFYIALIAPRAPAGPLQLVGTNYFWNEAAETFLSAPDALGVAARPPVVMEGPSLSAQEVTEPRSTRTYERTLSPFTGLVDVRFGASSGSTMSPGAWIFGDSGDFDDFLGMTDESLSIPVLREDSSRLHFVVTDASLGGGAGHFFDITTLVVPTRIVRESDENHGELPGQLLAGCVENDLLEPCMIDGSIEAPLEVDVFRIEASARASRVQLFLRSDVPLHAWIQNGSYLGLGPAFANAQVQTGLNEVANSDSYQELETWTLAIYSPDGATGRYLLGVRALETR